MPAWVRNTVKKQSLYLTSAAARRVESDPGAVTEMAAADTEVSFVNVEFIAASTTLTLYQLHGARADLMRTVGTHNITAAGLYQFTWPAPLGAAGKVVLEATTSSGSTVEVVVEVDECYRAEG
jgi:hypothetical protein